MPEVDIASLLRRLRAMTLADLEDLKDATLHQLDRTVGRLSIGRVLRPRDDDIVLAGSDDEYPATHALDGADVEVVILAALHAAAAALHHWVPKDRTLLKMLPWSTQSRP